MNHVVEYWDLFDENRNLTGKIHQRGTPISDGFYHIVIHSWIVNSQNQIVLTKRHPNKPFPNLWECSGGSILAGEESLEGAIREVKEEIGIELNKDEGKLLFSHCRKPHHDFYDVWLFKYEIDLSKVILQEGEVTEIKLVSPDELIKMSELGQLVPTLSYMVELIKEGKLSY